MNSNTMYSSNVPDNGIYNNQYNNNVIYTTYQNTTNQPSVVGQQGDYPSLQYKQTSQTQYINTGSLPSPISMNIKNENMGNTPNQNQNILYSPVSSASTASPSASNANTFNNSDPSNLSSTAMIPASSATVQNNNIISNSNNNSMPVMNNSNDRRMSMNFANDNSTNDLNNNTNYNPQNMNNYSNDKNVNASSTISPTTGSYLVNTQASYTPNQYVSTTTTTNSYYSTNGTNNNQVTFNQQTTPLPVPQPNIGVMNQSTQPLTQANNTQQTQSYIIQQPNMTQQSNQNMIVVNSNASVQNRPSVAVLQTTTTAYNPVYYASAPGPNGMPAQMQSPHVIFNNINENFLYEQQKMISMELAIKRKKNTEAARRSRMRKMLRMEKLEKYVKQLENDNNTLNMKISLLESNRPEWIEKETKLRDKIRELEKELAELKAKRKYEEDDSYIESKRIKKENKKIETAKEE